MEESCIERDSYEGFSFFHIVGDNDYSVGFQCHDSYEIYISVSGGKNFIINNKIYSIMPRDLFFNNHNEIHKSTNMEDVTPEYYILEFRPEFVLPFCKDTDLLHYFNCADGGHKINLTEEQYGRLKEIFDKYEDVGDSYGGDVLKKLYFVEMLVYISEIFRYTVPQNSETVPELKTVIAPILDYISENLSGDLSLDNLAAHVNLSKYYMCKLFKKCTGTTIMKYIVKSRIAKAKELLGQKCSSTEVCVDVGFNDYCHFIRTFRKNVGTSPLRYAKSQTRSNS
ncbi:MAG: AraC family transcriptional regulator [Bacillota bacterium]|nr:AraC family transcriptional regulator [Bacillota bacterium]